MTALRYFLFEEKIICSDRHETLLAVSGKDALNPGDRMAVTSDLGNSNNMGKIQGSVEAVTVQDIMEKMLAPSYIIKTDIQKYDCKVPFYVAFTAGFLSTFKGFF